MYRPGAVEEAEGGEFVGCLLLQSLGRLRLVVHSNGVQPNHLSHFPSQSAAPLAGWSVCLNFVPCYNYRCRHNDVAVRNCAIPTLTNEMTGMSIIDRSNW